MEHTDFEIDVHLIDDALILQFVQKTNITALIVFAFEFGPFVTLFEGRGQRNIKRILDQFIAKIDFVCGIQYIVEADGDVYPCDFYALDAWRLGNIRSDTLAQIDEKRSALGFFARSIPLPAQCAACPWLRLCRNGCYRQRDAETGLSKYCASYRLFFEQRGDRLAALAQRISRGKPLA